MGHRSSVRSAYYPRPVAVMSSRLDCCLATTAVSFQADHPTTDPELSSPGWYTWYLTEWTPGRCGPRGNRKNRSESCYTRWFRFDRSRIGNDISYLLAISILHNDVQRYRERSSIEDCW